MKAFLLKTSLVLGILVASSLVLIMHTPYPAMLSVFFIGLGLTFASGPQLKTTPNYIASLLAGIIWVLFYFQLDAFLHTLGMPSDLAFWLGIFILVMLTAPLHLIFLEKTWFNQLPLVYGAVTCVFMEGPAQIPGVIMALTMGVLVAVVAGPIAERLPKTKAEKAVTPDVEQGGCL
ncbi:MAG: DUF1097 family protein [Eubacterium sp.]